MGDSKLTMDATASGAEAKTKNLQNRGLKRRTSANNGFEKEENDSNSEELLQLQWSNHSNAFGAAMSKLRSDETFCDVTLVSTKGEQFSAHKVVISACSTQLQSMLKPLPGWQHPVLLMPKDIPTEDLRDILAFMYSGEVWIHLFFLFFMNYLLFKLGCKVRTSCLINIEI